MARESLLAYLKKMVFWADVQPAQADLAVLSLIGPHSADTNIAQALGIDGLPDEAQAAALPGGGFVRPIPGAELELDLLVPRSDREQWLRRLEGAGVRRAGIWAYEGPPGGRAAAPTRGGYRRAHHPHEVDWIGRAVHLDKGCYRGQETVARVHNLGRPPRMLVLLPPRRRRGTAPTGRSAAGRRPLGRSIGDRCRPRRSRPNRSGPAQTRHPGRHHADHRR